MSDVTKQALNAARTEVKRLEGLHRAERSAAQRRWREAEAKKVADCRAALERECGVNPAHFLANPLWEYAWEQGHSYGLEEIAACYRGLVEAFYEPVVRNAIGKE